MYVLHLFVCIGVKGSARACLGLCERGDELPFRAYYILWLIFRPLPRGRVIFGLDVIGKQLKSVLVRCGLSHERP